MLLAVMASCSHQPTPINPRDTVQVPEGYTGEDSIAYIEDAIIHSPISVEDLLDLSETHSFQDWLYNYNNSDRAKEAPQNAKAFLVTRRDSCAVHLGNRFMRMYQLVTSNGDAMDQLQFAMAVNAILDTFRAEVSEVAPDSALGEIERVMAKFSSQTQLEMNMHASVLSAIEDYRTLEAYRLWLAAAPNNLKPLAQNEYKAWYDLNEAHFAFWHNVSYRQEWYSMKPMEIAAYRSNLADNRRAELAVERSIILEGKPYRQLGRTVTTSQWEKWLAEKSVPEDYDLLVKLDMHDRIPDKSTVDKLVIQLRTSFSVWLAARQAFAAALPEDRGKSYDNLTADIHSRIVGKLQPIVPYMDF